MSNYSELLEKIKTKSLHVGIIGLGYVGLPLAIEFALAGFKVYGIDINKNKIQDLREKKSYIIDVSEEKLSNVIESGNFIPTSDYSVIQDLDAISICVPTPLTKSQEPDMSYIMSTVSNIKNNMHEGLLITLESTTYPGTTEELIEKELELAGYNVGENYFLCFSPERVDPGNEKYNTKNTPKVIGGTTTNCTNLGETLYGTVIDNIVPVSSTKVAEMSKLLENTFRSINIAFINEMALLCDKLNIDIWETIDAANTKPFGFMKFTPGPGIGGHCIPLDPMYLSWKAKESNFYSHFIELAQETNKKMPEYVYRKVSESLNEHGKSIKGSKILILGMAYKPDIDDLRESPGLEIYELLKAGGGVVEYNDPHATSFKDKNGQKVLSIDLTYEAISLYDCVVLITNHKVYDLENVHNNSKLIVDTRNALKNLKNSNKVFTLGLGNEKNSSLLEV
ncbi:nucleotide sugar dehydrogenase [Priestia megaterium]|uniref:nucleotide sugar dehydrogenase n=1 Tax=Priestia megaterium TaxID=1404 RepID=UPI000BF2BF2B|nr:nucleotide sugar dehydrogenase [Priestia megaterium]PFJ98205.1 UDP-N-acetyl-D-glucosamine dehydrogenase [Priestia megaterium]PMD11390.1 nucleotide sugar dehydrogenase [Priestia megaterium]